MNRVMGFLCTAVLLLCPTGSMGQVADPLHGDWAGWIYLDGGNDLPFRFHVRGNSVTVDLPHASRYQIAPDHASRRGNQINFDLSLGTTRLRWQGSAEDGAFQGTIAVGDADRSGVVEAQRSPAPLPTVDLAVLGECIGTYRFPSGRQITIGSRPWGELRFLDIATGRIGTLFATSDSTAFAGSADYVPTPITARAICRRGTGGSSSLVWTPEGADEEIGVKSEFTEEEAEFSSAGATLRGTWIRPARQGRYPAVVVLGGSNWEGRGNVRAETEFLVGAGVGVFIYDKRGYGDSSGEPIVPFETSAGDAIAAGNYLKGRADVKPDAIGLFTRSRGGWFAPIALTRSSIFSFAVLLVPPGVTPRRQETTNRLAVLAHSFDLNEGDSLDAATYLELLYHYSETRRGWSAYSEMREEMDARGWLDVLGGAAEDGPEAWEWNRLNAQYDPVGDWDDVRVPVLAVFGTEDLNVIPTVNVPPLRAALAASGNRDVTTLVEPGVDHSLRYGGLSIPLHRRVGYGKGVWALIFRWLQRWSG